MVGLQIHCQCAAARASTIDNRLKRLDYKEMGMRRTIKNGEKSKENYLTVNFCGFLYTTH